MLPFALLLPLIPLGVVTGAVLAGSGTSPAAAQSATGCPAATQPVGGYPAPNYSPPPDSTALADWSGQSFPIAGSGQVTWTSSIDEISGLPSAFAFTSMIVGGQAVTTAPPSVQPIDLGAGSAPGSHLMAVQVTFNVACTSGSPEFLLWEARAESSSSTPMP